ncbi:TolC family protein [Sediminibacterium sp.]|uniref:TolC family protein n=1 Tax=Sediminibacterium sp. TaxID=1917865 RepID=UPI00273350A9|nr:TolC family protein [Sediminibacterium sp.]MDP3394473.1 TolC family protein [Sediminibacterium sp.]MDP3568308.1 TolC family protein [Sediminibacterium sp.]
MRKYLFFFGCAWAFNINAQVLSPEKFIEQVRSFHPIAKQANIKVEKANAALLSARGQFDPTIEMDASRKTFDGKNYYFYTNPEFKVPTKLGGLDIKAGLEDNGGLFLNNQITRGQSSYLGLEMPLLKGLLIDQRRASLQQASLFTQQSEQDRLKMQNDLLYDAYNAYWQWAGSYQLFSIYRQFLQVSLDRFRLVKLAYANGDRALIDTVEALTQVQQFQLLQTDAKVKLVNAQLEMANFLWNENDAAYLLNEKFVPDTVQFQMYMTVEDPEQLINRANEENPSLRSLNFELAALEVERKLKFQSLLPSLNVKANLLNQGYNVMKDFGGALLQNNYVWGVQFKIPIFLREGQGSYRQAKLKIAETNYELNAKQWSTANKIRSYYAESILLKEQIAAAQQAFNGYTALLKAESLRFQNGESSLFLLNTRENKVIETAEKLIQLRAKYLKASYGISWAAGVIR